MNLKDAYKKAILEPIKHLPRLSITRVGGDSFFLKETEGGEIILTKDACDEGPNFYLTMEDFFSESWELTVTPDETAEEEK